MCNSNSIIKLARHTIISTWSVNVRCSDTAVLSTGLRLSEWPRAISQSLFLSSAKQKTVQMKCLSNWTHKHTYIVNLGKWSAPLRLDMQLLKVISLSYIFICLSVFCCLCLAFPIYTIIHRDFVLCMYVCAYSMCVRQRQTDIKGCWPCLSGKPLFNELLINAECWFTLKNVSVCAVDVM